jgi:RNA polymerase sigma-70 factor (sigma-E family)
MNRDAEFRAFVLGSRQRLTHFAELLVGDHGRAEDLVQDGYLRAYRAWARVSPAGAEAYVRRCILNARVDWWRRPSSHERPTAEPSLAMTSPDHSGGVDQRLTVLKALARLTTRERAVITLRYYLGLSEAEIAAELGIAPGTVKSAAARAIDKLRSDHDLTKESCNASR